LRDGIQAKKESAIPALNDILLAEFAHLGIKYEEATWDDQKNRAGRPKKRALKDDDIAALKPFHWGYEFDRILAAGGSRHAVARQGEGGFDAIITNPPWEIFKPNAKEFFEEYSDLVSKKKMSIKDFEKAQASLLKDPDIRAAWLKYLSEYPHVSAFYRSAPQYENQISIVNGKKAGSDTNLYKLFTEQCFNLLRAGGYCGIVIPSGIYTDLGTKQLREMLFGKTRVTGLFCIENRKFVFEGVDCRFKFVILSFEKYSRESGAGVPPASTETSRPEACTTSFPAAFMRHDVAELERFPQQGAIEISVPLVRRLAPDSLSVMEFKNPMDVQIAEKMLKFPLLGERIADKWNVSFTAEFHMTSDSHLFKTEPAKGRLPLYEGKMIWHFDHRYSEPRYWVIESEGRAAVLGRREDDGRALDYLAFRLGFRDIASNTNERTLVSSIIPPTFHGNKIPTVRIFDENGTRMIDDPTQMFLCAAWNSYLLDYLIRMRVTTTLNFFYLYQLPVPRLPEKDAAFRPIVERAARLICTTPEFDDLAKEIVDEPSRLVRTRRDASSTFGATDPAERAKLRAELDALVAHLYGLTEAEFAYILTTFPLVPDPVKIAAHNAFRNVERGLVK
jgi:hypothetical protein